MPPGRSVIDRVDLRGPSQVSPSELSDHLATHATSSTLGLFLTYEVYDRFVVERDLQRIERFYRTKGFYDARAVAGRVIYLKDRHVRVEVLVEEGSPIQVKAVRIELRSEISEAAARALTKAQTVRINGQFDETKLEEMKQKMQRALTDHGYAHARVTGGFSEEDLAPEVGEPTPLDPVTGSARVKKVPTTEPCVEADSAVPSTDSLDPKVPKADTTSSSSGARRYSVRVDPQQHSAQVFFVVDPGPLARIREVQFVEITDKDTSAPLTTLPEDVLRAEAGIRANDVYSSADLESARLTLLSLGVFSTVEVGIPPEYMKRCDPPASVPVVIRVRPSPLHTLTFGGGSQIDVLRTDVHLIAGYQHNNFLGGLRKLVTQVKPGLVLFPTNLQNALPAERVLPEVKAKVEIKQPAFLEARTNATVRTEFLVYPYLLSITSAQDVPEVVLGYYEFRWAAGLDRGFFAQRLNLSSFYNLQLSYPFTYFGPRDEGIQRVIVSYVSLAQALDLRDNPLHPHYGMYLSNDLQLAGGVFRGDADDVRVQPDVRFYAPVTKWLTMATRTSVGFLFPRSYGSTLTQTQPDATLYPDAAAQFNAARNRDLQLLFFRAFFSGGPNSNRGYPIRGVGPRGIAPFKLGGVTTGALAACQGRTAGGAGVSGAVSQVAVLPAVDPEICGVALGGLSLWEASLEFRIDFTEKFATTLFVDSSNVTRQKLSIQLDSPHVSTGVGLRYETPVGPLRFDVGYAIPKLQCLSTPSKTCDPQVEGVPTSTLGLPVALNIAVGEAFLCRPKRDFFTRSRFS